MNYLKNSIFLVKIILAAFLFSSIFPTFLYGRLDSLDMQFEQPHKPRVVVLTDIMNEPDDQQSLVRFLVYSNEYDVEGLVATTSVFLPNRTSKERILEVLDGYGKVRDNLLLHAPDYPSLEYLKSVSKAHLPLLGLEGVGQNKGSEGSRHIIEVVDREDNRPIWITVWGGANCLAQALWEVRENRSKEELDKFVSKLRVYAISDQDDTGRWLRTTFPNLFYIVSPSSHLGPNEFHKATWAGISGDKFYQNGPMHHFDLVSNEWLKENIVDGHGPLGEFYLESAFIMEGDTPSFLGLIDNGLGSSFSPAYGGWGGRYSLVQTYAETRPIWTNDQFSRDEVVAEDGLTYVSDQATIWRWREAYQHDFAARMDWCVKEYSEANHNPIVTLNGNSGKSIVRITAKSGDVLVLDAFGSYDPDGDELNYRWFAYKEATRFFGEGPTVDASSEKVTVFLPTVTRPTDFHLICEVKDSGEPTLFSYRRIVVTVNP